MGFTYYFSQFIRLLLHFSTNREETTYNKIYNFISNISLMILQYIHQLVISHFTDLFGFAILKQNKIYGTYLFIRPETVEKWKNGIQNSLVILWWMDGLLTAIFHGLLRKCIKDTINNYLSKESIKWFLDKKLITDQCLHCHAKIHSSQELKYL